MNEHTRYGRREWLKRTAAAGAGLGTAMTGSMALAQAEPANDMPKRVLGKTGEQIPILLMGGEFPFDPRFDKMLHTAYKQGMTYIDTAQTYANGKSHIGVGNFISQVGRENLWITTKAGLWGDASASPPERYTQALEKELPTLQTDHADLFFMHGVKDPALIDKPWVDMGADLKKRGLTKFFGFSCHDGTVVELLNRAAKFGAGAIDAIMFKYSFAQYGDADLNKAMDACVAAGIGLIAMKTQDSVPQDQEEVKNFQSANFNLFQAKLKAAWADERISACVSGITNMQILRDNVGAAKSVEPLAMHEFMQLNQYAARTADHRCKLCNHVCESRVEGPLRIADQMRYLMYDECYGQPDVARQLYHNLSPAERRFEDVDLAAAMEACPRGINIRQRLEAAKARLA